MWFAKVLESSETIYSQGDGQEIASLVLHQYSQIWGCVTQTSYLDSVDPNKPPDILTHAHLRDLMFPGLTLHFELHI